MAKQIGPFRFSGKHQGMVGVKSIFGHILRSAPGRYRFKSSESRRRKKNTTLQFRMASKAGEHLRKGLWLLIRERSDAKHANRLVRQFIDTITLNESVPRRLKDLRFYDLRGLAGYNFNINSALNKLFYGRYEIGYDTGTGEVSIHFGAFKPKEAMNAPAFTSHFRLISGSKVLDFKTKPIADTVVSDWMEYNDQVCSELVLTTHLPASIKSPIIVLLGLEFCDEVNGEKGLIANRKCKALAIAKVFCACL